MYNLDLRTLVFQLRSLTKRIEYLQNQKIKIEYKIV